MELEAGSLGVSVFQSTGRRRVSGVGRWVTLAAGGVAVHRLRVTRRRRTHEPRHVSDHVDEGAGHDEGGGRS
jgi:hypothetical protein